MKTLPIIYKENGVLVGVHHGHIINKSQKLISAIYRHKNKGVFFEGNNPEKSVVEFLKEEEIYNSKLQSWEPNSQEILNRYGIEHFYTLFSAVPKLILQNFKESKDWIKILRKKSIIDCLTAKPEFWSIWEKTVNKVEIEQFLELSEYPELIEMSKEIADRKLFYFLEIGNSYLYTENTIYNKIANKINSYREKVLFNKLKNNGGVYFAGFAHVENLQKRQYALS